MRQLNFPYCLLSIALILTLWPAFTQAQPLEDDLLVDGRLKEGTEPLQHATVTLLDWHTNEVLQVHTTNAVGIFETFMSFDREYKLMFELPDYHTKHIYISTHGVPDEAKEFGFEYGGFTIQMLPKKAFRRKPWLLKYPVAKIRFWEGEGEKHFDHDREYSIEKMRQQDESKR